MGLLGRVAIWMGILVFAPCAGLPRAEAQQNPSAVLLIDASRSMASALGPTTKIKILRGVLASSFKLRAGRLDLGLVTIGQHAKSGCDDVQTLSPVGPFDKTNYTNLVDAITPQGASPIAKGLQEAAKAGDAERKPLDIVLVTDSLDSCKAAPCDVAAELKKTSKALRINVIAFDYRPKSLKSLACLPERTGGQMHYVSTARDLTAALSKIFDNPQPAPEAVAAAPAEEAIAAAPAQDASAPEEAGDEIALTGDDPGGPEQQPPAEIEAPAHAGPIDPDAADDVPANPESRPEPSEQAALPPPADAAPAEDIPADPIETGTAAPQAAPAEAAASGGPVPVTLTALLTEQGPKIQNGLIWRVFNPSPNADGGFKLIGTFRDGQPAAQLQPGEYLVNAAYGLSNLTKKIKVATGNPNQETFILNTGGLRLNATLANGDPIPPGGVRFDIFDDDADQFGNRQKILGDAQQGLIVRLNAGGYHIVSTYGDANASVRADVTVEPGKLTEATVNHAAAKVTFRLASQPGGEALADTQWTIQTPTGDTIKESAGALPTHVLAAGAYSVVAKHGGESYTREFKVDAGEAKQVELVVR